MCNLIENYKIKKALKQKERQKRIEQACCPHHIAPVGEYDEIYSVGYSTKRRTIYEAYCPICDKTFYYTDKVTMTIDLAKQQAREEYNA